MPGHIPSLVNTSLWQTPHACTLMRTCPAVTLGTSRSTSSKSPPGREICAAFIGVIATFVVAMITPASSQLRVKKTRTAWKASYDAEGEKASTTGTTGELNLSISMNGKTCSYSSYRRSPVGTRQRWCRMQLKPLHLQTLQTNE